ncbi:MAG: hypothetical protein MJZ97_09090, partial [Bacteroidales bacterium]|nr:hypothetical protein [Bacteroidales bacterium]
RFNDHPKASALKGQPAQAKGIASNSERHPSHVKTRQTAFQKEQRPRTKMTGRIYPPRFLLPFKSWKH